MAEEYRSEEVKQCLQLLDELEDLLNEAKPFMFGNGMKIINSQIALDKLTTIKKLLPDSIKKAVAIVGEAENIRQSASEDARTVRETSRRENDRVAAELTQRQQQTAQETEQARRQAQQLLDSANLQAKQTVDAANQQYNQMMQQAQYQATQQYNQILQQARLEADQLKSKEQVYQSAREDAERIRTEADSFSQDLSRKTFDYLDGMMGQLESFVSAMLNDVHQERDGLNGRRP